MCPMLPITVAQMKMLLIKFDVLFSSFAISNSFGGIFYAVTDCTFKKILKT